MQPWRIRTEIGLVAAALIACAAGCFPTPKEPLVEGPTLRIEIAPVSEADVTASELVAAAALAAEAQTMHAEFLAANEDTIDPERLVALQGARIRLRAGNGVDDLADAFGGLMIFVAPEGDPTARVFLASAVAPASEGPLELELVASRLDYEDAQTVLTSPSFLVGVSGPTPLDTDRAVEFGLTVDLDLAIFEIEQGGGGHG